MVAECFRNMISLPMSSFKFESEGGIIPPDLENDQGCSSEIIDPLVFSVEQANGKTLFLNKYYTIVLLI